MTRVYNRKERAVPYQDTHGKGILRDDPKLANIQPGKRFKITTKIPGSNYVNMEATDHLYFCDYINSHGVYFFETWDTDRKLALTWMDLLEMIASGDIKEVK